MASMLSVKSKNVDCDCISPETNADLVLCGRVRFFDFLYKLYPNTGLFHNVPEIWSLIHNEDKVEKIASRLREIDTKYRIKSEPGYRILDEAHREREKSEMELIKEFREDKK